AAVVDAVSGSSSYVASDGAAYEGFIGRWTRRVADRLATEVPVDAEGPLLDVGCGTGSLVAALRVRHPARRIVGLDISEPYLAFARQRAECEGAELVHGDAQALPFPDDDFAAAHALIALNFMTDPLMAAREMVRVVRPGGKVVATSWDFRGGLRSGLDISEPYLAFARQRAECEGAELVHGDAQALPFPDDDFAAAHALIALNFMTDPLMAAREMVRVVRPGGKVVATSWDFRGGL